MKHTTVSTRSYQYVGIYEGAADVVNGVRTDQVNANLTAITHIPRARLVVTVRVEATLLRNSQNTSTRAFTTTESGRTDTGGNIYGGNSFTAVYPTHYMDTEGNIREFKNVQDLSWLVMHSSTAYTFALQGYDPYLSANVSVTKELGKHVSMSFFANNFTNSRPFVKNRVTGQSVIFTPDFYYGLTCRIKL